ncbi:MAG: hypothetical protein N4A62_00825 [Marinisporobacter sp.]|jgi:hypothetical protein|nr:hypothetical protein [Marinisporobacter sp.]
MEVNKNKRRNGDKKVIQEIEEPMSITFTSSIVESYQVNGIKEYPAED